MDVPIELRVPPPFIRSLHDIVAGTAGGLTTVIVGHPLDTIKVRMQSLTNNTDYNMMTCIRETLKNEGFRGFYKGMQSPLLGEGFFNAIQFFAYGWSKEFVMHYFPLNNNTSRIVPGGELSISQYYIAGATTGFVCSFVECPIDFYKTQLQTQIFREKPLFYTFPTCVSYVYRHNGLFGGFQGLISTFLRTIPASACYFGVYESCRTLFVKQATKKQSQQQQTLTRNDLSSTHLLISGGLAGIAYWLSSFPMDTVKSAIQSDSVVKQERRYEGVMDCVKQMYRQGGIARFYRGLAPCLIRSFPANAACFFAYERAHQYLEKII